jgi:hypothetical protein
MRTVRLIPALTIALAASAWAADSFSLVRRASIGDKLNYTISMVFQSGGAEVVITGKASDTVIDLKDGVITTERELRDVTIKLDKDSQSLSDIVSSQIRMKTTGEVLEVRKGTPRADDLRAARAIQIEVPFEMVKIGDKWSRTFEAKTGLPELKSDYTVLRSEKVGGDDAVAIRLQSKESGGAKAMSADGTFWINTANGMVVKFDVDIKNFPLDSRAIVDLRFRQDKS